MFEGNGVVTFHVDGKPLAEVPFPDPDDDRTTLPLPDAVLEAMTPGAAIEWTMSQADKALTTARFEVIDDSSLSDEYRSGRIALQQLEGQGDELAAVRDLLELELLVKEGLDMAAHIHAAAVESPSLRTHLLHRKAWRDALGEDAERTSVHGELQYRIRTTDAWTDEERKAAYDPDGE